MPKRLLFIALFASAPGHATRYDAASVTARWALGGYKALASPLQGRHVCNFEPTCSQFSMQAVERQGLGPGILMTADRLERCNPYAQFYLGSYYQGIAEGRICDPVENHAPSRGAGVRGQGLGEAAADFRVQNAEHGLQIADSGMAVSRSASTKELAFADYLFGQRDYARAIGEYERSIFTDTVPGHEVYARLMIGESFYRQGDYAAANSAFRDAITSDHYEPAYLGMARSLLKLGRTHAARHYALVIRDSALVRPAVAVAAQSFFLKFDFPSGAAVAGRLPGDSLLSMVIGMDGTGISRRSPVLSAALSTAIPGLGQTYSGRLGDGLFSFTVVATAAAVSWYYWNRPNQDPGRVKFAIAAGLGTVFHLGNIYGAAIAGRDYNQRQNRDYLARIEGILGRVDAVPDYRALLDR
jgi:putative component of membrane protein insertase Oxa1/YidC/SpoIIIJ protein YidD